jgi:hypothetical protein
MPVRSVALALALAFVLAVCNIAAACSTPLSLRGARVMEPGEFEVLASPQLQGASPFVGVGSSSLVAPPLVFPWIEGSLRFGLFDRADLQLRFDPTLLPEVSMGYQLVGDPAKDDQLAVTVTGGAKVTPVSVAGVGTVWWNTPLQVLVDLPLGEMFGVMGGLRIIPNGFVAFGGGAGGGVFGVAPGAVIGARMKVGSFVLSPEFAVSANFPFFGVAATSGATFGTTGVGQASGTFGLNIGGQFGGPAKTVAPPAAPGGPAPLL